MRKYDNQAMQSVVGPVGVGTHLASKDIRRAVSPIHISAGPHGITLSNISGLVGGIMSVTGADGRIVASLPLTGASEFRIDMPRGVYIVHVHDAAQRVEKSCKIFRR